MVQSESPFSSGPMEKFGSEYASVMDEPLIGDASIPMRCRMSREPLLGTNTVVQKFPWAPKTTVNAETSSVVFSSVPRVCTMYDMYFMTSDLRPLSISKSSSDEINNDSGSEIHHAGK